MVDYGSNDESSPPYPLSDEAAVYVERLFEMISNFTGSHTVPTSGFRFLVQLILSKRCTSIGAFGFSGGTESVYFREIMKEKVTKWHNPSIELSIMRVWNNTDEFKSLFKLYS